jgi:sugar-phosphatase
MRTGRALCASAELLQGDRRGTDPVMSESPLFKRTFGALLFDMDGTIISSVAAAERVWAAWAQRQGQDVATFLPRIHGVRGIDVITGLDLPGIDAHAEVQAILLAEIEDVGGIEALEGAAAFLASLPPNRWAIVTSSPRQLALRRLEAAGLPPPAVLVTGEDIEHGKPAPDCFLLAAKLLGQKIEDCVVFEDAPAGIQAAEAAGAAVVVVTALHKHPLDTNHPTITGYGKLTAALLRV